MRATNNTTGNPTGAIGGMFSYISQPWTPPQYGQDEMIDILVETYANNIRRTMGGVSINGNMKVLDLGASQVANKGTYNTWILFGDPTLTLRNDIPAVMSVSAVSSISTTATSLTLSATNADGALATLTRDGEIMGSATITDGSATITFTAPGSTGTATLTVFGYNKKTYVTTINITNGGTPTPDPLVVNVSATQPVIAQGGSTQLSVTATGGYGSYLYSWAPSASLDNPYAANPVATPQTTTTYTCTVTSQDMSESKSCTVTVVKAPTNLTAAVVDEDDIVLNWNAANPVTTYTIYLNGNEIYNGITTTTYTIPDNDPGTYTFEVATHYNGVTSPKSNSATVTVEEPLPVVCPAPDNFTGVYYWDNYEFGVQLEWDRAEYEYTLDRFELYRSTDGENYKMIKRIVNTPSITHYGCTDDEFEEPGEYYYQIIAFYNNDCQSEPVTIQVDVTSSAETVAKAVTLYPNPTNGNVNIKAEAIRKVAVYNTMGQRIMVLDVNGDEAVIDMSRFGNGIYMLDIITEKGNIVERINVIR